ncbi:hypothetical protein AGMMS5026_02220 [Endomicrobiia bacterium]|nr:hypothetical protein AGMMS49523_07470 [Endomicrobiia bacterium]GHT14831.1 hypothetical protein AGMMS49571_11180 [Endomicrobiia bacterium]GHT18656.1 hypothetical protein AGMMS49929_00730 [Endomicrobiia bacterium]GHT28893.1 hypothetical protein AGMMS49995_10470 [Endomicrobiia bacterium]GHT29838.1 hypothetical protein AGMMS5026_02220 [Endomicrobiia bacterium]
MKRTTIILMGFVMMFMTGCGLCKDIGLEVSGVKARKEAFLMGYCTAKADELSKDPIRSSMHYKATMSKLVKRYSSDHDFEWEVVEKIGELEDYV